MSTAFSAPLSAAELIAELQSLSNRYWDKHPFHVRLRQGELSRDELRLWISNRWYYQQLLPQKDAAIIANCPDQDVRRAWLPRIIFQDGTGDDQGDGGGIARWITLATAAGLTEQELRDERHVLPGTRFAADAYLNFCRTRPWIEAVASSLTEMFSPGLLRERLTALREHYPWIAEPGHSYFVSRPPVAERDAKQALNLVTTHCLTRESQEAAVSALAFKCDVLWTMLDAIEHGAKAG
jgi:pyrroloquinoline-quinone synthase